MIGQGSARPGSATENVPLHVALQLRDGLDPDQRVAIEVSVEALARRAAERATRRQQVGRARAALMSAAAIPLQRALEEDAAAQQDIAAKQQLLDSLHRDLSLPSDPNWPPVKIQRAGAVSFYDFAADQLLGAPWDFQWQWFDGRAPTVSNVDRPNGRIQIQTAAGGSDNRSDAHGGFGVALSSASVQAASGRSLRSTDFSYNVGAGVAGGTATAEGGMEMTVIENGAVLSSAQDKVFRKRVSNGEDDSVGPDGFATGGGIQVDWVMQPGHTYTFNVGGWVFCESHDGIGFSGFSTAWANLNALVIALTVDHQE
jgi:hypothetical protein